MEEEKPFYYVKEGFDYVELEDSTETVMIELENAIIEYVICRN